MSDASSDAIMLARAKKKVKSKERAEVVKRRDVAKWNRAVKDADEYLVSAQLVMCVIDGLALSHTLPATVEGMPARGPEHSQNILPATVSPTIMPVKTGRVG